MPKRNNGKGSSSSGPGSERLRTSMRTPMTADMQGEYDYDSHLVIYPARISKTRNDGFIPDTAGFLGKKK